MKTYNTDPNAPEFVRFTLRPRLEHLLMIFIFVALAVTGLPQKFSDAGISRGLVHLFRDIETIRKVHRFLGFSLIALAVEHLGVEIFGLVFRGNRASMVPSRADFTDAIHYLRYCLGLTETQPKMDRYDYRQKFEYWGLLMGTTIMVVSGLILYWPIRVASIMPGVVVAAAKVAHSNEAMLALLTVVTWHVYGAHLNPEIFPIDKSIFTGKISRKRMLHEHRLEFERWFGPVDEPAHDGETHEDAPEVAAAGPDSAAPPREPPAA